MTAFVTGTQYSQSIHNRISGAGHVDVAVAFLGERAADLIDQADSARVICNLESGATNPRAVRQLRDSPTVQVRTLANLHAKVIVSETAAVFGSANLSANGLGLEEEELAGWEEAGADTTDPMVVDAASTWFHGQWERGQHIDDETLSAADEAWSRRQSGKRSAIKKTSSAGLFGRLMEDPEFARERPLYIVAYREHMGTEAQNTLNRSKKDLGSATGPTISCYENWETLPPNSYLIDFYCGPKWGLEACGLYWTGPENIIVPFNYSGAGTGSITIVFKLNTYEGLRVRTTELNQFTKWIKPSVVERLKTDPEVDDEQAFCLPLYDFLSGR